jgi:hypothetical protein
MADFYYNDSELQMDSSLILCIEECENTTNSNSIDTRLFIGWDNETDDYYVRGKRQDIGSKEFVPYAFRCESTNDLYDFIEFAVGTRSLASVVLYNFNNMEGDHTDNLTYEFFENNMDRNYEIAAYDEVKLKRSQITKYLRMLKNTYNWDKPI